MAINKTKNCKICLTEFSRPKGYSNVQWNNRKLCSNKKCSTKYLGNKRTGIKHTEEHKRKIGISNIGKKRPKNEEYRKKISAGFSIEMRNKISGSKKGENNPNWKGGISPKNTLIRMSAEYRLWREAVFIRDNWTCVWCSMRGGKLNADHIKPFSLYPELRFAIDNGRTLCVSCHRTTDTWGFKNKKIKENDK